jgi:hypothetical protein
VDLDVGDYYAEPEMASADAGALAAAPVVLGVLRSNFRTADSGVLASFKEALLADGTDDEFFPFLSTTMQDRTIREGDALTPDNPYDVHSIASSHLMWLVRPCPAAELLAELASRAPAEG